MATGGFISHMCIGNRDEGCHAVEVEQDGIIRGAGGHVIAIGLPHRSLPCDGPLPWPLDEVGNAASRHDHARLISSVADLLVARRCPRQGLHGGLGEPCPGSLHETAKAPCGWCADLQR